MVKISSQLTLKTLIRKDGIIAKDTLFLLACIVILYFHPAKHVSSVLL